eukprot:201549-Pyramimonas_sp.AAC.1
MPIHWRRGHLEGTCETESGPGPGHWRSDEMSPCPALCGADSTEQQTLGPCILSKLDAPTLCA